VVRLQTGRARRRSHPPALTLVTPWHTLSSGLKQIYWEGEISSVRFISSDDAKLAATELINSATASRPRMARAETLSYAAAHPDDPRVPESPPPYRGRATRYGCTGDGAGKISKSAYDVLHKKYPDSPWTKKTPTGSNNGSRVRTARMRSTLFQISKLNESGIIDAMWRRLAAILWPRTDLRHVVLCEPVRSLSVAFASLILLGTLLRPSASICSIQLKTLWNITYKTRFRIPDTYEIGVSIIPSRSIT